MSILIRVIRRTCSFFSVIFFILFSFQYLLRFYFRIRLILFLRLIWRLYFCNLFRNFYLDIYFGTCRNFWGNWAKLLCFSVLVHGLLFITIVIFRLKLFILCFFIFLSNIYIHFWYILYFDYLIWFTINSLKLRAFN